MAGQVLDGKACAQQFRSNIANEIKSIQGHVPGFAPNLAIIQVGNRPDSATYVRMKRKAAEEAGIVANFIHLDESATEFEVLRYVDQLNEDPHTHGIIVQLPLPAHLDEDRITSRVLAEKDVDGFGPTNIGELNKKNGHPFFLPCTPKGIIELLHKANVTIEGSRSVVIGRSDIVGSPVAELLKSLNSTVTITHSKTRDIASYLHDADIVVVAIGQPEFVKGEWFKPRDGTSSNKKTVVIDVGTNYVADPSKKSGFKCVGDVEFNEAIKYVHLITPVPGGVGPMTVAMLMQNTLIAAKRQMEESSKPLQIPPLPLKLLTPVPSDIDISRAQQPKLINQLAQELGIYSHELELYGHYKAKISPKVIERLQTRQNGKYILVSGITPTPLGEGKSTTTMGLVQALTAHLGKPAIANVRQPSLGPTLGVKGGAAGGGYSQVIPMDEFNLHLTGDIHAIGAANNLLAAAIDTRMFHETTQKNDATFYNRLVPRKNGKRKFTPSMQRRLNRLGIQKTNPDDLTPEEINKFARLNIDPDTITIKRVVDINDRMLRQITIGQAPTEKNHTRVTGFDITVASELMAILALSKDLRDMKERIGRVVVAADVNRSPVTVEDVGCTGALTALLRDAIKPNLMQTLEGTPVLVHAGPFANISIGASSVIADRVALKLVGTEPEAKTEAGYVVTEAGFDFTMGGERFFNIKCRSSGLTPNAVVLVATVRALKSHGGAPDVKPGQPLPSAYTEENIEFVEKGAANMCKQIANIKQFGVPVVVAINKFETDTEGEIAAIRKAALEAGAFEAVTSNHWAEGGKGAIDLAKAVIEASNQPVDFHFLYDVNSSVEDKLTTIVQKMYGGAAIDILPEAQRKIDMYKEQGFGNLPICIAKTQYSLSHDATLKGVPTGFTFPIRDVRLSNGAGYLYALAAEIQTIPGLATYAGYMAVEVDDDGEIDGLF